MSKIGDFIVRAREAKGWDQKQLVAASGYSQSSISAIESGVTVNLRNWRKLADVLDADQEEFARLIAESAAEAGKDKRMASGVRRSAIGLAPDRPTGAVRVQIAPPTPNKNVPVFGRAQGGPDGRFEFNGEVIGWEVRPPDLEGVPNVYAVYVDGESMWPRYKPGETVWVNPNRPAKRGEDVVVQLHPEEEHAPPYGFIKEYVGWQPTKLVLHQHNPETTVTFERSDVISVHPIVMAQRT